MIILNLETGEITEVDHFEPFDQYTAFKVLPEHEGYAFTGKIPQ